MSSSATEASPQVSSADRTATSRWSFRERAHAALLRRLQRWFDLHVIWVFRRPLAAATSIVPPEGYTFREVTAAELLEAAADPALELSRERIRDAAARGDLFFGVFHRDRLIAYRWYSLSGSTPCWPGMLIRHGHPHRAYGYRTFTHPDHRGKRLHTYATVRSDEALVERGCTHAIGYIDATNLASLRAYSRMGSTQRVGRIASLNTFGRQWVLRSPGAIRNHVTLVEA